MSMFGGADSAVRPAYGVGQYCASPLTSVAITPPHGAGAAAVAEPVVPTAPTAAARRRAGTSRRRCFEFTRMTSEVRAAVAAPNVGGRPNLWCDAGNRATASGAHERP